ncbi:hypothetical protein P8C59_000627 [Phyllachora maydis]|uniref:Uncharacterized protein n=1 Tax=Phyllachora maydis TaxID=1825666 RepID=A0AAD9HXT0_9PEZI|nr:hypothetical protein P8C59_000627 [Phyllachora maydis]
MMTPGQTSFNDFPRRTAKLTVAFFDWNRTNPLLSIHTYLNCVWSPRRSSRGTKNLAYDDALSSSFLLAFR